MSAPQSSEDREALQREIQAAIAAGRDLDPDMDQHLATSALERYTKEKEARDRALGVRQQQAVAMPRQPNPNLELIVRSLGAAVIIGGIIFAIAFSHGAVLGFWWLIFFLGPMLGWSGRRWGSRRAYYYSGAQHHDEPDEEEKQRQRAAKRQAKITALESELKRLRSDDYV
jgi:hypothetical protein